MKNTGFVKTLCAVSMAVFISCAGSNSSTNQAPTLPDQVVGEVNGEQVTYTELKESYMSGSITEGFSYEELNDFLPIYLNYKAKILSAQEAGYFENEKVVEEYELYSKQAAYSFWLENQIRPTMFNEFKERYDAELKSSHVLIAVDPQANPRDTLDAYNKLVTARNKFLAGTATMADLDKEYSTMRGDRSMGGELPWFSVGTTVREFEEVLYSLELGEISQPFRTQFGYHIVLLEQRRAKQPSRDVSHIFTRKGDNQANIDSAFIALENGTEWNEVVKSYSEDTPSISTGGKIGWINYGGRYDAAFIDSVMHLDVDADYSKPIETVYGFHIMRVDSVEQFESEEERNKWLMTKLEQSPTFKKNNSFVIDWIRDKYDQGTVASALSEFEGFVNSLDSARYENIILPSSIASSEIYRFEGSTYTAQNYLTYLINSNKGTYSEQYRSGWLSDYTESIIDGKLTEITIRDYPEFIKQTDSYKTGLVVYQINEDSVWSSATLDTTILMNKYEDNLDQYSYNTRYHYHMVTSSRDTSLQKAIDYVNKGNSPDSIRASGIAVGVVSDSTGAFQGEPFDKLESMEVNTFSDIFEYSNRKGVFYLNAILPARTMTFDEAFNRLVSDYQPEREENWMMRLRDKYDIKSYPENLQKSYQLENNVE